VSDFVWDSVPVLKTARLKLRALTPPDREALFAIYGDSAVMRYASDPAFPNLAYVDMMLVSVATLFQRRESLEWGLALHTGDQVIGTCGVHSFDSGRLEAEIGCLLHRAFWGQSLMREALEAVIAFSFDGLHLHALHADIDAPNTRSLSLFRRLGFQPAARGETIYTLRNDGHNDHDTF
jgi:ribosomal-protein-alanine N-acetyltransferase